jgi:hypothetical protein
MGVASLSSLFLFVFGVFANDHDIAFALYDFAFFADGFDRRSDFHDLPSLLLAGFI